MDRFGLLPRDLDRQVDDEDDLIKVYEVMTRQTFECESCQSLMLKMRDEGVVKFESTKDGGSSDDLLTCRFNGRGIQMKWILDRIGRLVAAYLQKPAWGYEPFVPAEPTALRASIKPGDILLIEGHNRISGIIEYLTRSTWSHAALYVGPTLGTVSANGEPLELVESNLNDGIVCVPLSKYFQFRTRICRPIGLASDDCQRVCNYAVQRIGLQYDLKNLVDLARYLIPLPFPRRWRRRMIALGSGDPTRLICSALIAQAFGYVGYPVLPNISLVNSEHARQEIFHIRDSSLYAPRDFDVSPYFAVIKPTIEIGFDYKKLNWAKEPVPSRSDSFFNRYELSHI